LPKIQQSHENGEDFGKGKLEGEKAQLDVFRRRRDKEIADGGLGNKILKLQSEKKTPNTDFLCRTLGGALELFGLRSYILKRCLEF